MDDASTADSGPPSLARRLWPAVSGPPFLARRLWPAVSQTGPPILADATFECFIYCIFFSLSPNYYAQFLTSFCRTSFGRYC